jgi:hypothetical protein
VQLQTDPHSYAGLTTALGPLSSEFLGQSSFERIEIHRLLEKSCCAEIITAPPRSLRIAAENR